jgi:hypothetical protein
VRHKKTVNRLAAAFLAVLPLAALTASQSASASDMTYISPEKLCRTSSAFCGDLTYLREHGVTSYNTASTREELTHVTITRNGKKEKLTVKAFRELVNGTFSKAVLQHVSPAEAVGQAMKSWFPEDSTAEKARVLVDARRGPKETTFGRVPDVIINLDRTYWLAQGSTVAPSQDAAKIFAVTTYVETAPPGALSNLVSSYMHPRRGLIVDPGHTSAFNGRNFN